MSIIIVLKNVVSGVTGVVTKPVAGARKEGVGGFFKGIGAGVIGLVTQPAGGVVDLASNTLASVKRYIFTLKGFFKIKI